MPDDDDQAYGTTAPDAPVTRVELERAIRSLNLSDLDLRDAVLTLGARVVALTDELTRRLDGVEPLPAAPNTPAPPPSATVEAAVEGAIGETLGAIRASDMKVNARVSLDLRSIQGSKYEAASPPVPCEELIHLCEARCCTLSFSLSTEDLDEGVIRWDYGQPYLIRQRASDGYCVHNDPQSRACTVHHFRPRVCRSYDCRNDDRIWIDFDKRIVAPVPHLGAYIDKGSGSTFDLIERAKVRAVVVRREMVAVAESFGEPAPRKGPKPQP